MNKEILIFIDEQITKYEDMHAQAVLSLEKEKGTLHKKVMKNHIEFYKKRLGYFKELKERLTPKKVIRAAYKDIYGNKLEDSKTHFYNACPSCKDNVGIDANYCRHCGQKICW